ncbi:hypothetical protein B0H11DRAFT_1905294 [Mycena galericulata]|nr:hypothetical protein B0H11DRAFT_1905294 [Mycena galericulata]
MSLDNPDRARCTSPCYIFLSPRSTVTACLVCSTAPTASLSTISTEESTMDNNTHHTRAATRAGVFEPPAPLFSPETRSPAATEAGSPKNPSAELSASAVAAAMVRPTYASALGISSVSRTGDNSSELPLLTKSDAKPDTPGVAPASDVEDDGDWTPVTRKTSRSHREHSSIRSKHTNNNSASNSSVSDSESESTFAKATHEMSIEDLDALVRRHEAITAQFRAMRSAREQALGTDQENVKLDSEGNASGAKNTLRRNCVELLWEEVEDEGDLINFNHVGNGVGAPETVAETKGFGSAETVPETEGFGNGFRPPETFGFGNGFWRAETIVSALQKPLPILLFSGTDSMSPKQ